jgi:2-keto-4-pentenoate hydratase/2-oxohepta-3-ene-1,7-dioic acid hydratase in catechol pathway
MKLVGYEDANKVMIGSVAADGGITPLGERDDFWRDPKRHLAQTDLERAPTRHLRDVRQVHAVPASARVICIGLNYRNHALEGGRSEVPTVPVIFGRWTASLVSDGDECPLMEERYDWEGELGAVIGEKMFRVDAATGLQGVFGYCAFNDLSARSFQRATPQWTFGKNAEKSGPMSAIVTADAVGDPAAGLRLTTRVNDQVMQDDNTRDLIFPVGVLIEYISQLMTLNPGDLIATGTPAGVGFARRPPVFLKAGDTVEIEIEKVGKVTNKIVALTASAK